MGIKGLSTYIESQDLPKHRLERSDCKQIVVCDALALLHWIYPTTVDWIRSGQWDEGSIDFLLLTIFRCPIHAEIDDSMKQALNPLIFSPLSRRAICLKHGQGRIRPAPCIRRR